MSAKEEKKKEEKGSAEYPLFTSSIDYTLESVISDEAVDYWLRGLPYQRYIDITYEKFDEKTGKRFLYTESLPSINVGDGRPRDEKGRPLDKYGVPFEKYVESPVPAHVSGVAVVHGAAPKVLGISMYIQGYGSGHQKGKNDYELNIDNRSTVYNSSYTTAAGYSLKGSVRLDKEFELAHCFYEKGNEETEDSLIYLLHRSVPPPAMDPIATAMEVRFFQHLSDEERARVKVIRRFTNKPYWDNWLKSSRDKKNEMLMKTAVLAAQVGNLSRLNEVLELAKERKLQLPLDLQYAPRGGNTALILGARNGRRDVVAALLAAGANINAQNSQGNTALMEVAARGNLEMLKFLLASGAKNKQGSDYIVILMNRFMLLLSAGQHAEAEKIIAAFPDVLLRYNALIDILGNEYVKKCKSDVDFMVPLADAIVKMIESGKFAAAQKTMLEFPGLGLQKERMVAKLQGYLNGCIRVARFENFEALEKIFPGMFADYIDSEGNTLLILVAKELLEKSNQSQPYVGHVAGIRWLMQHGANKDIHDSDYHDYVFYLHTVLKNYLARGQLAEAVGFVKSLPEVNVDRNYFFDYHVRYLAPESQYAEFLKIQAMFAEKTPPESKAEEKRSKPVFDEGLVAAGIACALASENAALCGPLANIPDQQGRTALHRTAIAGDVDRFISLLELGGNPEILDNEGNRAYEVGDKEMTAQFEAIVAAHYGNKLHVATKAFLSSPPSLSQPPSPSPSPPPSPKLSGAAPVGSSAFLVVVLPHKNCLRPHLSS